MLFLFRIFPRNRTLELSRNKAEKEEWGIQIRRRDIVIEKKNKRKRGKSEREKRLFIKSENVTHIFVEIILSASPGENAICLLSFSASNIPLFPKSENFVPYKLQFERGNRARIIIITVLNRRLCSPRLFPRNYYRKVSPIRTTRPTRFFIIYYCAVSLNPVTR